VPGDLLERRPDIAAAERHMAEMNAEIGIAKAALYPSLKLGATVGAESSAFEHLTSSAARVWELGPELQWDVFAAGRNRAKIDAAKARYDQTAAEYLGHRVEGRARCGRCAERQHRCAATPASRAAADRRCRTPHSRPRAEAIPMPGSCAFFEVLDAQRTLLHAEEEQNRISGESFLSTVLLIKALGGGW